MHTHTTLVIICILRTSIKPMSASSSHVSNKKRPRLDTPHDECRVHVVAAYNFKGGVGKTHVNHELACELVRRGHHVLALDVDGQMD